jgi:hypothetical protein
MCHLKACFESIEQHAEDCKGVRRVSKLLLAYCQQNAWDLANCDALDMLCMAGAQLAYT